MKQPVTLWIIVALLSTVFIIVLGVQTMALEDEVEQLQEENIILTDQVWILNQHLTNEVK